MKKIKVIFDRSRCIGASVCVSISPKYWQMADDGLASLEFGVMSSESRKIKSEIEVNEDDLKALQNSARSCPVQVIEIIS